MEISNISFSLFSYFRDLFFFLNMILIILKNSPLHIFWLYPEKKYFPWHEYAYKKIIFFTYIDISNISFWLFSYFIDLFLQLWLTNSHLRSVKVYSENHLPFVVRACIFKI